MTLGCGIDTADTTCQMWARRPSCNYFSDSRYHPVTHSPDHHLASTLSGRIESEKVSGALLNVTTLPTSVDKHGTSTF